MPDPFQGEPLTVSVGPCTFGALAHGASLDALKTIKTIWMEEGDFQKLVNDQTHPDIQLDRQMPPRLATKRVTYVCEAL